MNIKVNIKGSYSTFMQKCLKLVPVLKKNFLKICVVTLWVVPILVNWVVLKRFSESSGVIATYDFNISENAELFGKISDVDRTSFIEIGADSLIVKDRFEITKEKVEFSLSPIRYDIDDIMFEIEFGDIETLNSLLLIQNFRTGNYDQFLLRSETLEELGSEDFMYNGYKVWSFNEDISNSEDLEGLTKDSNETISVCNLESEFFTERTLEIGADVYTTSRMYPHVLRGSHTFLVYVGDEGILHFGFKKRDLNWYNNIDTLVVVVSRGEEVIRKDTLADDGVFESNFDVQMSGFQEYDLALDHLPKGTYQIEVESSNDVILYDIESINRKFVLRNDIFLVNSELYGVEEQPMSIYTNSDRFFVTTYHDTFTQQVQINDVEIYSLAEVKPYETLDILHPLGVNKVTFEQNDVLVSGSSYWGLSEDSFFVPSIVQNIVCVGYDQKIISSYDLLVSKGIQNSGDPDSIVIPFSSDYIGPEGVLYFVLYNPGLGVDTTSVEVSNMKVVFIKDKDK